MLIPIRFAVFVFLFSLDLHYLTAYSCIVLKDTIQAEFSMILSQLGTIVAPGLPSKVRRNICTIKKKVAILGPLAEQEASSVQSSAPLRLDSLLFL